MTLNEISDPNEIINLCDVFLFGILPDGKFATPWAETEFSHNTALMNGFKKDIKHLRNNKIVVGRRYKDANGLYRVFLICRVDEDGHYNADQLTALKMLTDNTDVSSRMFPLIDTFGFGFDLLAIPSQDGPSDQPGGIFIAGDIPVDVQETIKQVFSATMVDIFICNRDDVAEQVFGLQDARDLGTIGATATIKEHKDESNTGDSPSQ